MSRTFDLVDGRYCTRCGYSHAREDRLARIRRMLPCSIEEIRAAWPCLYADEDGHELARRDLRGVGATPDHLLGDWGIP